MPDAGRKRRNAAIIRQLDIPRPFDLGVFTAGLERQRGRPIRVRPFRPGPAVPCGLWIATTDADYVYYEQGTTPFHVTVIVLHEIAHMLLGHRGPGAWQNLARQLTPEVDASLVRLILGRSAYAMPEERDAEILASRILEHAAALPAPGRPGMPVAVRAALACHAFTCHQHLAPPIVRTVVVVSFRAPGHHREHAA